MTNPFGNPMEPSFCSMSLCTGTLNKSKEEWRARVRLQALNDTQRRRVNFMELKERMEEIPS